MLNDADPNSQPSFWIAKATILLESGDEQKYAAALVCARKAFNMAPHEAAALHILGLVLYRTEKYKEAEVWLQKAESIDPKSWSIALTLALTKYALGDLDGSVEVFSEAIARAPDEPMRTMIRMQMAHPILASGDYKRGLLLREGRQVPTTQELGAAPAVASSALRVRERPAGGAPGAQRYQSASAASARRSHAASTAGPGSRDQP